MDVVKAVETYITKLVSTPSAMKVLLLDSHTVRVLTFRFAYEVHSAGDARLLSYRLQLLNLLYCPIKSI